MTIGKLVMCNTRRYNFGYVANFARKHSIYGIRSCEFSSKVRAPLDAFGWKEHRFYRRPSLERSRANNIIGPNAF